MLRSLRCEIEETSPADGDDEFLAVDVNVETNHFVASGASIQLGCRSANEGHDCDSLYTAYLPYFSRVSREDGLSRSWPDYYRPNGSDGSVYRPIPIGEVSVQEPRQVRLTFRRDRVVPGTVLLVTATAQSAESAVQGIALAPDEQEDVAIERPSNDRFAASERLSGSAGETAADLALATREPGEPLVSASSRTLWYHWRAPAKGLFRFRLREAESGDAMSAEFAVFTGSTLLDLEQAAFKRAASEITFDAQAGTTYRLRVATFDQQFQWDMAPLVLGWERADSRPANDDLAFALAIKDESGSLASTNEGATLELSEFLGGFAATRLVRMDRAPGRARGILGRRASAEGDGVCGRPDWGAAPRVPSEARWRRVVPGAGGRNLPYRRGRMGCRRFGRGLHAFLDAQGFGRWPEQRPFSKRGLHRRERRRRRAVRGDHGEITPPAHGGAA